MLRYEEIAEITRVASGLGITRVRLTGGEPLVKRNIETLVQWLAEIPGIREVAMTTNGSLLTPEKAEALKKVGLKRINISLDTLDPVRFAQITRGGCLDDVLRGIAAAHKAGLVPIKINMVVLPETTPSEIQAMQLFCHEHGTELQRIMQFSLHDRDGRNSLMETERPPKCESCNRLRLTADGRLKPCLFSDHEAEIDMNDIASSIREAVASKPKSGAACRNRGMSQIGG